MGLLGLPPIDAPLRLVVRALDDLHTIASVAREAAAKLDALDSRAAQVQEQIGEVLALGRAIDRRAKAVVALGERIDTRGDQLVALGAQLEARGTEVLAVGERMLELGDRVMDRSALIAERAKEVADRGGEVVAALPILERAVEIVVPMEGAVERLGRLVDRLPGNRRPTDIET